MTCEKSLETANIVELRKIGQGFCGTVWASDTGPAFKREDGGPDRSLQNDFEMHQRTLQGLQKITGLSIHIPRCDCFIEANNHSWWSANHGQFPLRFQTPCNMIQSQRIPPFPEPIRKLLIEKYCPEKIALKITNSQPNKDCLVRPYLGRRRLQNSHTSSRFKAFSLRNFPLHLDQMEELAIPSDNITQYARAMAETLGVMHWIAEIDGNDIEFVLAPCDQEPGNHLSEGKPSSLRRNSKLNAQTLGDHCIWVLDFDLCRRMTMDSKGVEQAASAFWRNDHYYPRPGNAIGRDHMLWIAFREHYIDISEVCIYIATRDLEPGEADRRRELSRQFIERIEQEALARIAED